MRVSDDVNARVGGSLGASQQDWGETDEVDEAGAARPCSEEQDLSGVLSQQEVSFQMMRGGLYPLMIFGTA